MEIVVTENNIRIDKYLQQNTEYSRSLIQKMIASEHVLVNNLPTKANYLIKEEDIIIIKDGFVKETKLEPENIKLDIIYEDEDLIIINKQSGMVVHPGNGNSNNTLVNALMYHTSLSETEDERPGIVHRLDKDTSGRMIAAKNNKAHELLTDMFKRREVNREYTALVVGEIQPETATIDAPIGRDNVDRKKMAVTDKNSKEAKTHFKVINRYKGYTLLELKLDTGRTHQIRVHLKYINYPVYNDPVYTTRKCTEFGQYLHSSKISFNHPVTNEYLEFTAPLPDEFTDFLNKLEQETNIN